MRVEVTGEPLGEIGADLEAVGLFEGEELPRRAPVGRRAPATSGAAFQEADPAAPRRRSDGVLVVGLGKREELDPERLRVAAARRWPRRAATTRARSPGRCPRTAADREREPRGALVEGTVLASYRFDRFKSRDPDDPPPAGARAPGDRSRRAMPTRSARPVEVARIASAEAANRARDLQNLPANVVTPTYLPIGLARSPPPTRRSRAEVLGRAEIEELRDGRAAAVAKGSARGAAG